MSVSIILDFDGVIFKRSKHLRKYLPLYLKILPKVLEKSLNDYGIGGLSGGNLIKSFLSLENFSPDLECLDKDFLKLLYLSYRYNFLISIVSSSEKREVEKYLKPILECLQRKGIEPKLEIIASDEHEKISPYKKGDILRGKKSNITIFVGDSNLDFEASKNADVPFVVRTFLYYLSYKKPIGKSIKSLKELVDFLYQVKGLIYCSNSK